MVCPGWSCDPWTPPERQLDVPWAQNKPQSIPSSCSCSRVWPESCASKNRTYPKIGQAHMSWVMEWEDTSPESAALQANRAPELSSRLGLPAVQTSNPAIQALARQEPCSHPCRDPSPNKPSNVPERLIVWADGPWAVCKADTWQGTCAFPVAKAFSAYPKGMSAT